MKVGQHYYSTISKIRTRAFGALTGVITMLFNGKLVFCQFPILFNGNLRLEKLDGRNDGRMERWTDGLTDICADGSFVR